MPMIRIQTNHDIVESVNILKKLSSVTSSAIGKPEAYIMTSLQGGIPMTFAGTEEPVAFIECKSIGLSESQTGNLSKILCSFCEENLEISKARVYIEFTGSKGSMWGWNGGTF